MRGLYNWTAGGRMKVAVLVDGGHLRVLSKQAGHQYDPDFIEKVGYACVSEGELFKEPLYYDRAPYNDRARMPVSGEQHEFKGWIGLDIANFANQRTVERIVLVTRDTDCVPAMKYA
jgi:hypothetical protein